MIGKSSPTRSIAAATSLTAREQTSMLVCRRGSGVRFNRRDSKSREPLRLRGFESPPLRHPVFEVRDSLQDSTEIAHVRPNLHLSRHQRQASSSDQMRISAFCLCSELSWCREKNTQTQKGYSIEQRFCRLLLPVHVSRRRFPKMPPRFVKQSSNWIRGVGKCDAASCLWRIPIHAAIGV
jgi:hypothetical protein